MAVETLRVKVRGGCSGWAVIGSALGPSRGGKCDAIENGYSTRTKGSVGWTGRRELVLGQRHVGREGAVVLVQVVEAPRYLCGGEQKRSSHARPADERDGGGDKAGSRGQKRRWAEGGAEGRARGRGARGNGAAGRRRRGELPRGLVAGRRTCQTRCGLRSPAAMKNGVAGRRCLAAAIWATVSFARTQSSAVVSPAPFESAESGG